MSDIPVRAEPSRALLERYASEFSESQTLRHFGLKIVFPDARHVEIVLDPVRPEHRGGLGTDAVNGGVLAAVFDLAIGCTPALIDPRHRTATMQLSMSFERPVLGDALKAVAEIDSAGESVLFASAKILDQRGKACARCQGVVRLSKLPWVNGASPMAK